MPECQTVRHLGTSLVPKYIENADARNSPAPEMGPSPMPDLDAGGIDFGADAKLCLFYNSDNIIHTSIIFEDFCATMVIRILL
jgi:hypothetical protein